MPAGRVVQPVETLWITLAIPELPGKFGFLLPKAGQLAGQDGVF